jgi:5-aminolevulinate synthase
MDFEQFFADKLDALRTEARYRVFAEIERRVGRFLSVVRSFGSDWIAD